MTTLRQAAQQALEALEDHAQQYPHMQKGYTVDAIIALRDALTQEEQEPVAWTLTETLDRRETTTTGYLWFSDPQNSAWTPLYTHPPRRESQGLAKEDIAQNLQSRLDAAKLLEERRQEIAAEVLMEREACAKVCDGIGDSNKWSDAHDCAAAIRARSKE